MPIRLNTLAKIGSLPALTAGLLLTGCATHPVQMKDSKDLAPAHRLGQPAAAVDSTEQGGKLIVTRDSGPLGAALLIKLFVDGEAVAKLDRYERFEVILNEGDHVLGVIAAPNLLGTESVREASVTVRKGRTFYFRVGFLNGVGSFIQRSAFTK